MRALSDGVPFDELGDDVVGVRILEICVVTAARRFFGPRGGGSASVGRTTLGSGLAWLLRTNEAPGSSCIASVRVAGGASAMPRLPGTSGVRSVSHGA